MTTLVTKSGHIYILLAWCNILISKVEQDGLIGSGLLMLEAGKLTIRHQLLAKVYLQRRDVGSMTRLRNECGHVNRPIVEHVEACNSQ
jgi:hypothetical protein